MVLEKEWLELRLQRGLLLATLLLPPVITVFAVAAFLAAGSFPGTPNTGGMPLPAELRVLEPFELGQALVGRQFAVMFMLLPIFIPSVLASYAVVGEKRDRTLEPVLATPIRTWELLTGKSLAALLPAIVVTFLSAVLFIAGTLAFAVSDRIAPLIITPGWIVAVVVDTPLLALIGIALIVVVSSRVNDPRTAQQISAILIVPVMALLFAQLAGVVVLSSSLALEIGAVLLVLVVLSLRFASRLFEREVILTRWR